MLRVKENSSAEYHANFQRNHRHDKRSRRVESLGTMKFSAGKYDSLRFNVTAVTVEFVSGRSGNLHSPSGTLKAPIPNGGFQITATISVTVQLLSRSMTKRSGYERSSGTSAKTTSSLDQSSSGKARGFRRTV